MPQKKTSRVLFFVLLLLTSRLPAIITFTETMHLAMDYWGIGVVGVVATAIGCVIKCGIRCCCTRRRAKHIKRTLSAFDAQKLLNGMVAATKEHIDQSSHSEAFIYKGELSTTNSWYIISGAKNTDFIAKCIQRSREPFHDTILGLILIGASFDHALLADHSEHSDVSPDNLSTIANHCIDHKVPLLILYLGQDTHTQHVPAFGLSALTLPGTETLFDDPRARLREHNSLTVESLLERFGPAIAGKACQIVAHSRGAAYPDAKRCKHEVNRFIQSLRNYTEDEVAVTVGHEA